MTPAGCAVMFHRVCPDDVACPPGQHPLRVSQFEAQLDWLRESFDILAPDAFISSLAGAVQVRDMRPVCLLTFDDGTRDHLDVVLPILARRGLAAVFFVLVGPARDGMMPTSHLLHWCLGRDDVALWRRIQSIDAAVGDDAAAVRVYHYESPLRARIKYALNFALTHDIAAALLREFAIEHDFDIDKLAREEFLRPDDIHALHAAGMTIGIHGVTHQSLRQIGVTGMVGEVRDASAYLHTLLGVRPHWFSCPYGASGIDARELQPLASALADVMVEAAVSTEKAPVQRPFDPLHIPRYDTIDLPPLHEPPEVWK